MILRIKKLAAPARQHGFSMIEVMVTLAVLSVGLLGFAALQTIGFRFNHQSYQRTQAVFQAYDILDRIRANWTCVPSGGCAYDNVAIGNIPGGAPNCISSTGTATCSNTDMATYDVAQWNSVNSLLLNSGRGAACRGTLDANFVCTAGAGRTYSVALDWVENDLRMRIDVQAEL